MRVRFGDVTLDTDAMELHRADERVAVEPQVMEVLTYLVTHRERMVPKTELLDEIWGDRFVSESALSSRIKSARQAIGDNGRDQRLIRTVHGRGFRFVGEIQADDAPDGPSLEAGLAASGAAAVLDGLTALSGVALEVIGPGSATRAVVDDILHAAEQRGLLAGRGAGAGELRAFASVLEGLDEVMTRRPDLLDQLPTACRVELQGAVDGRMPSSPARLLVATRELLRAAARAGGVVLVVEDVHLIDGLTIDLIRHIARASGRSPIALVVTHRSGFTLGAGFTPLEVDGGVQASEDLPAPVRAALRRAALIGPDVTLEELVAVAGLEPAAAERVVAVGEGTGGIERTGAGFRFVDPVLVERLVGESSEEERRAVSREVGVRRTLAGARRAAEQLRHSEVLDLTDAVADVADPALQLELVELRADALAALGDLEAVRAYRTALRLAPPEQVPWLRARLARVHLRAGDVETAAEVLGAVDVEASDHPGVRMVGSMVAYFSGDLDLSERLLEPLRDVALSPGASAELLDVIAMQGMIAHSRGEWFDRLRRELRLVDASSDLARTVFDSHICVAQYLLYGPTGHDEVIRLAREMRESAEGMGATHAVAFAQTLEGEGHLLEGDLAAARECLESGVELYRRLGTETGLAHALQRLAEVSLNEGDRAGAEQLAASALPLARWSPLSQHLLQRVYGTLIASAPDPAAAAVVADDALATIDDPEACLFCYVMVAVPATIAYAGAGRIDDARSQLAIAERVAARWDGPAWPAATSEAAAMVARAEGREADAATLLERAAAGFDMAHQPIDAARCREAL